MASWDITDPTGGLLRDLPGGSLLFESSTEEANRQAVEEKRKAADYYRKYAPEAMRVRQEMMRKMAGAFNPLQQYIQRMTGAAPFDMNAAFQPMQDFQGRMGQQAAEQAPKGGGGFFGSVTGGRTPTSTPSPPKNEKPSTSSYLRSFIW